MFNFVFFIISFKLLENLDLMHKILKKERFFPSFSSFLPCFFLYSIFLSSSLSPPSLDTEVSGKPGLLSKIGSIQNKVEICSTQVKCALSSEFLQIGLMEFTHALVLCAQYGTGPYLCSIYPSVHEPIA